MAGTNLDQRLVDAAIELLRRRFPRGEGVAAALYTKEGTILTSVGMGTFLDAGSLCAETGAILEAHKLNQGIAAIACVSRESAKSPIHVLTPCGVCQERLVNFGMDLQVAVPLPGDSSKWQIKALREVQPFHWSGVFEDGPAKRK